MFGIGNSFPILGNLRAVFRTGICNCSSAPVHDSFKLSEVLKPDGANGRIWGELAFTASGTELQARGCRSRTPAEKRWLSMQEKRLNHFVLLTSARAHVGTWFPWW